MVPTLMRPIDVPSGPGNPLYPLPPDYEDLTTNGQRLARLNAICRQSTPEEYVAAWSFFRGYYLRPPETHFYDQWAESPPLHYHLIRDICLATGAIVVVPRGFAKSVILVDETTLLEVLTRPGLRVGIVKAKGDFVTDMFDRFRTQIEHNPYILEDFGKLRPPRGGAVWDYRHIRLTTHSHIYGLAIEGKGRGLRVDIIKLDDVEYDPSETTNRQALTKAFVYKLTRVYIPMMREGARTWVIGTLLDRDVFLFHCATTKTDRRFSDSIWMRRIYAAFDDRGRSMWEAAYSTAYLERQRLIMGDSGFEAEYLSNPGLPEDALFQTSPAVEYDCDADPEEADPLECEALVRYREVSHNVLMPGATREEVEREVPLAELLDSQYRFLTVDYAPTTSPHSDYSAIHVLGLDSRKDLWSWDLWVGRATDAALIRLIWKYARRWRAQAVGVEAVGLQISFVNQVAATRDRLLQEGAWLPRVIPIKYRNVASKETRIARLEWRFTSGKIKLPVHRKYTWPYKELYYEIAHFTPEGKNLAKDDPLDTLAMAQEMVGGKSGGPMLGRGRSKDTVLEALERGEKYYPGSRIPLAASIDFNTIPRRIYDKLSWERYERARQHHDELVRSDDLAIELTHELLEGGPPEEIE